MTLERMVAGLSLRSRAKFVEEKIGSILLHLNSGQKNIFSISIF